MKKIIITVFMFSLFTPIEANAFFNRDCSNLAKRTTSNQLIYEKAWNNYQNALSTWINSKPRGTDLWRTHGPVMNRFQQVGKLQINIMDDLIKYPKCLTGTSVGALTIERQKMTQFINSVDYMGLYINNYFSAIYDYRKLVKK